MKRDDGAIMKDATLTPEQGANQRGLESAKVALLVMDRGNRGQLAPFLGERYELMPDIDQDIDLVILDRPGLEAHRAQLRTRKESASFLPVVLLARHGDDAIADLGQLVDDTIRIPVPQAELSARLDNLLKLRRYSQEREARADAVAWAYEGVSRALRTFTLCNEALVHADDEEALLNRICTHIVTEGEYEGAWIGCFPGSDPKSVTVRAKAGTCVDRIDEDWARWLVTDGIETPFTTAIETRRSCVVRDIETDERFPEWRAKARYRQGIGALINIPLLLGDEVAGVLAIGTSEGTRLSPDEVPLLERLAANLSHGMQTLRDRAALARNEVQLKRLAYYDSLTGVPNREAMLRCLNEFVSRSKGTQRAAVFFIDLDGFKLVNDAMGHDYGDDLLRQVVRRIQNAVREGDVLARQGGDEFILLLPDRSRHEGGTDDTRGIVEEAEHVANRLIKLVKAPFQIGGYDHSIGMSVGISTYPDDAEDAELLLTQADSAMYKAKAQGGGAVRFYTRAIATERQNRLTLESQLVNALKRDEFELHYQPVFETRNRRPTKVEALIRWRRSGGDLVSPGEFLPVAAESRMMPDIGRWAARRACHDLAAWLDQGIEIDLALNISTQELEAGGIEDDLRAAIQEAGVPADRLILEITEDAMAQAAEHAEATIRALGSAGFHAAIDDFGTGYSSLSRLKSLPLSILKIDKSFVLTLPHDASNAAIVRAVVNLAAELELDVVAEGVETAAQFAFLRDLECRYVQGFLLAHPMPAHEFESWYWATSDAAPRDEGGAAMAKA